MTHEAVGLIDPLPTIQRLGGARPGVHEPISALRGQWQLTARHRHRALDRWNRPGIRLDVALVPPRGEPRRTSSAPASRNSDSTRAALSDPAGTKMPKRSFVKRGSYWMVPRRRAAKTALKRMPRMVDSAPNRIVISNMMTT